jgi:hypothetical protein
MVAAGSHVSLKNEEQLIQRFFYNFSAYFSIQRNQSLVLKFGINYSVFTKALLTLCAKFQHQQV